MSDAGAATLSASFRVAVVGAGPSGFYAAEALLRSALPMRVDLLERLPVPHGLVRYGVAPDHPKLKQVTAVFDRIAAMPGFRFVGGVEVGTDVSVDDLLASYHAVVLATGAPLGRRMNIAGEGLPGSHMASDFVGWYNGHPDQKDCHFDLSCERAVIVGQGNVSLDVARILLKGVNELRRTDIAAHALDALAQSRVREVHIVGRRGPTDIRFSPKELHEIGELPSCDALVDAADIRAGSFAAPAGTDAEKVAAIAMLERLAGVHPAKDKRCVFRFHLEPQGIEGSTSVDCIRFNRPRGWAASLEPASVGIECGLVFSSIGRRSCSIGGVPYDESRGTHANFQGRVVSAGQVVEGLYVCGWCKRGPQGTIGTNRACSYETAQAVLADLPALAHRALTAGHQLHAGRPAQYLGKYLDFRDWARIDKAEVARGAAIGKPREKFVSLEHLYAAAREEHPC
ncbi:FAD-dependent oxidoreductase [Variovorax sp. LjRoot290]|uniref:FAD-dependent oxidoreductase n=1 Tax=unclassified Variovorax TaxID=663243 RepID=UPI003ECD6366